jgi:pimeloyl-ACP methyl ester carboxylesterase
LMKILRLLVVLTALFSGGGVQAQTSPPVGEVQWVDTRPQVRVPLFTVWNPRAKATVVLFSGGAGGYGKLNPDGWPGGQNFLIRTGKQWASYPFNVVMVGRPSDGIDLQDGTVRTGELHAADNVAIFSAVKAKSPLPLWLVGTSLGTISATAAAVHDSLGQIAGMVLTSSVTGYKKPGAVPRQDLSKIRVPTLVVHHARDGCRLCAPHEAKTIPAALTNAPVKAFLLVTEGTGESGDPCDALHFHGYIGAEAWVVDQIARWIQNPTP